MKLWLTVVPVNYLYVSDCINTSISTGIALCTGGISWPGQAGNGMRVGKFTVIIVVGDCYAYCIFVVYITQICIADRTCSEKWFTVYVVVVSLAKYQQITNAVIPPPPPTNVSHLTLPMCAFSVCVSYWKRPGGFTWPKGRCCVKKAYALHSGIKL